MKSCCVKDQSTCEDSVPSRLPGERFLSGAKAKVIAAFIGLFIFMTTSVFSSDVNILVLGTQRAYSFNTASFNHPQAQAANWQTDSVAFDPATVGSELENIIQGTTTNAVTVDFQELRPGTSSGSVFPMI